MASFLISERLLIAADDHGHSSACQIHDAERRAMPPQTLRHEDDF